MSSTVTDNKHNDVEYAAPAHGPTRGQKTKRHCKRWWWAWLLGFGIFVMVVMLIVVYAILPKVAQDKINDSKLTLNSLKIAGPTADSFVVSMDATIDTGGGVAAHADLDPMEIELYLNKDAEEYKPFMKMPLDALKGAEQMKVVKTDVPVQVNEMDAMKDFAKTLMAAETFEFHIWGQTKVWLGKLNAKVDYDETVTMTGLNHLNGMVIKSYTPISKDNTRNMNGQVLIPNPSVATIEMGDVNLQLALDGKAIGTGEIPNLVLTPGNNEYEFNAKINTEDILTLAMAAQTGGHLTVSSNGTYINGERIPWLSAPLETLTTEVPFDVKH